jgi:FkbM family methyltransferase
MDNKLSWGRNLVYMRDDNSLHRFVTRLQLLCTACFPSHEHVPHCKINAHALAQVRTAMRTITNTIKSLFQSFDIGITRYDTLETLRQKLRQNTSAGDDIEMLLALPNEHASQLLKYLRKSKSQLRQDLFVLSQLNFTTNGFFVEFGATNGVNLSNTYLLEKEFGWTGILAEPAKCWHKDLKNNRSSSIDTNCVWKDSNSTVIFNEVDDAELSTINAYSNTADSHKVARQQGRTYDVKTISLNELLVKHNAPKEIDYLSVDTEGSELEILSNCDFAKHSFRVITCEHNYRPMRDKIFNLLSKNGYTRVYSDLSKCDDWYVKSC